MTTTFINTKSYFTKKRLILLYTFILTSFSLTYVLLNISLVQYSDGIPLVHRVMRFKEGEISIGSFLFGQHGNSIHPIVYFIAFFDNILFSDWPILQITCVSAGMLFTPLIVMKMLYDEQLSLFENVIIATFASILVSGGYNVQLYLPFQMVLTFTRLIFIVVIVHLSRLLSDHKVITARYYVWIAIATLCSPMHGMGLMFAGSIVYLHIIYRQNYKKILLSFLPIFSHLAIHLTYNSGFGEVSNASGGHGIKYFVDLVKCMAAFFGCPIFTLGFSREMSLILGVAALGVTCITLLYFFIRGLYLNNYIKTLKPLYTTDSNPDTTTGFLLAMLGIGFLASVSAAMFALARAEYYPSIGRDMIGYTLASQRYSCFAIIIYLYFIWMIFKFIRIKVKSGVIRIATVAMISCCLISTLIQNVKASEAQFKALNQQLDYTATAILTELPLEHPIPSFIFPGYQDDWYWVDQLPLLIDYFKTYNQYFWSNMPHIGTTLPDDKKTYPLENIVLGEFDNPNYRTFYATATEYPHRKFAPIVDDKNQVVGFVHKKSKQGFVNSNGKFIFKNQMQIQGFIRTPDPKTTQFRVSD